MKTRIFAMAAVLSAVSLFSAPLAADIVHLKDGRKIEGQATDEGDNVKIEQKYGSILVPKKEVLRVEEKATVEEIFEKRLSGLKEDDADGHFALYIWAKQNGIDPEETSALLDKIIEINPDHAAARKERGEQFFRGKWMKNSEAKRILAAEHAEKMRALGYVFFHGQWLKPEAKELLSKLEELDREQKKQNALLESVRSERKTFEKEKRQAKRDFEEAERLRDEARRERKKIEDDESRLLRDRTRLERDRDELDEERRTLDDEKRKVESDRRRLKDDARNAVRCAGDISSEAGKAAMLADQISHMVSQEDRSDFLYRKTEALTIAKRIKSLRDQLERLLRDF